MANELRHAVVGGDLSRDEWESIDSHTMQDGVIGSVLVWDGARLVGANPGAAGAILASGGVGAVPVFTDPVAATPVNLKYASINFMFGDGVNAIDSATEPDQWIEVPFDCVVNSAKLTADVSGDFVVDIWKSTYAAYPPTDANSITASAPPALSGSAKSNNTTLTGWTTSVARGDWLKLHVDSSATVKRVALSLGVTKT